MSTKNSGGETVIICQLETERRKQLQIFRAKMGSGIIQTKPFKAATVMKKQQKNCTVVTIGKYHPKEFMHEEIRHAENLTVDEATKMVETLKKENVPAYAYIKAETIGGPVNITFTWNNLYVKARVKEKNELKKSV